MNPWDRRRNEQDELEPIKWYSRFDRFYRPQGTERSMLAAFNAWLASRGKQKKAGGASIFWINTAKKWNWKGRAESWDAEQRTIRMAAEQQAIDEMNKRHINIAVGLQTAGGKGLGRLVKRLDQIKLDQDGNVLLDDSGNPIPVHDLSDAEIRHYLQEGIDLERLTRGLPGGEDGKKVQIIFQTQPGGMIEAMQKDDGTK